MHSRLAIIGAGTGGINISSLLVKKGIFAAHDISIFDPKTEHHYQSAYTMVGGGVLGDSKQAFRNENYYVVRPQNELITPGVNWVR